MSERTRSRALVMLASALLVAAFALIAGEASASEVVYNDIPATLPGNFASFGAEAYSYVEFGGQTELTGVERNRPQVEVVMSAWACQFGTWFNETCETPLPKKKFKWPLTLTMYEVGEQNSVGEELGQVTKQFAMPYRPSDDPVHCEEGRWYDAESKTCFHGMAFRVKFPALKVLRMPKRVIVGVSYDTSHYGPSPVGDKQPCNSKSGGCYYDALNIGIAEPEEELLSAGSDPAEPYIQLASPGALEEACGNSELLGEFGPTECNAYWAGDQPLLRITAH